MGTLHYGHTGQLFDFDDRLLAHLEVVITTKVRRRESFELTWSDGVERGSLRHSVWIAEGVPLRYEYRATARPAINPAWLAALMYTASTAQGLTPVPEPLAG